MGFGLTLDPSAVAELLLQAGPGDVPPAGTGAPPGLAVSDAPDELLDAVVRLLRLLDRPRDVRVLAPLVKREILWRLITGEQGAMIRQLGLADSSLTHSPARCGGSATTTPSPSGWKTWRGSRHERSAFYRNFQAVTAMSPIQFQKQIRLQEARLLLAARPTTSPVSVTGGLRQPVQFSREYRRQFGAPPSQDAVSLRTVRRSDLTGRTSAAPVG